MKYGNLYIREFSIVGHNALVRSSRRSIFGYSREPDSINLKECMVYGVVGGGILLGAYMLNKRYSENIYDIRSNISLPIQKNVSSKSYTLVVDLNGFLVSNVWDNKHGMWRIAKRPDVDMFLYHMAHFYEIVVRSTFDSVETEAILQKLDPYGFIRHRIYSQDDFVNGGIKVGGLNRDVSKVVIIGCDCDRKKTLPNVILVDRWDGNPKEQSLENISLFLENLVMLSVPDIRKTISLYKGVDLISTFHKKQKDIYEKLRSEALKHQKSLIRRFFLMFCMPNVLKVYDDSCISFEERRRRLYLKRKDEYMKNMNLIKEKYKSISDQNK